MFTTELYQTFREELIPLFLNYSMKQMERILTNSCHEANITMSPNPDKDTVKKNKTKQNQTIDQFP